MTDEIVLEARYRCALQQEGLTPRNARRIRGHMVTRDGRVFSLHGAAAAEVKPHIRPRKGYRYIRVGRGIEYVHRLVLLAFVGPCPPGLECRHLNGNPADNRARNLRWGTHLENMADRQRHRLQHATRGAPNAKLTREEVADARWRADHGTKLSTLARRLGVTVGTVEDIITGRTWPGVGPVRSTRCARGRRMPVDPFVHAWETRKDGRPTTFCGRTRGEPTEAAPTCETCARRLAHRRTRPTPTPEPRSGRSPHA